MIWFFSLFAFCVISLIFQIIHEKSIYFIKKRKKGDKHEDDNDPDIEPYYTDTALLMIMADMNHEYDFYDNGLMFEGQDAWGADGDGGWNEVHLGGDGGGNLGGGDFGEILGGGDFGDIGDMVGGDFGDVLNGGDFGDTGDHGGDGDDADVGGNDDGGDGGDDGGGD